MSNKMEFTDEDIAAIKAKDAKDKCEAEWNALSEEFDGIDNRLQYCSDGNMALLSRALVIIGRVLIKGFKGD